MLLHGKGGSNFPANLILSNELVIYFCRSLPAKQGGCRIEKKN
jgi:hypothetical protein